MSKTWLNKKILRKVPQVGLIFWVIKLLTTALGESTSDYLVNAFNPYLVVIAGFIGFALALTWQLRARRYTPALYWATVAMVAVFGTMAADVVHVALGVPYGISTTVFAAAVVAVFMWWKKSEHTLSIHSITTPRRELFYWATVSATFALGTAAGDWLAYSMQLGFLVAGIVFAVLFALPALGYGLLRLNSIAMFWAAYILTRPLGASFADWTGKAPAVGGLGWGDGPVAAVLAVLIIIGIVYVTKTHEDVDTGARAL